MDLHDTGYVYEFLQQISSYVMENLKHVKKIKYFSNCCAGQNNNNIKYLFN